MESSRTRRFLLDLVFVTVASAIGWVVYYEFGWKGVAFYVFWLFCMFGSLLTRRASRRIAERAIAAAENDKQRARLAGDPGSPGDIAQADPPVR